MLPRNLPIRGRNVDETGTASFEITPARFDSSSFSVFLVKDGHTPLPKETLARRLALPRRPRS